MSLRILRTLLVALMALTLTGCIVGRNSRGDDDDDATGDDDDATGDDDDATGDDDDDDDSTPVGDDDDDDDSTPVGDDDDDATPLPDEDCDNGRDDDEDGRTDCADSDCEFDPACDEPDPEDCDNGRDDDEDGRTDCADPDCEFDPACAGPDVEDCGRAGDEDGDGYSDCGDSDCWGESLCQAEVDETITPCDGSADGLVVVGDVWRFEVFGEGATLEVDTNSSGTSFDPAVFRLEEAGNPDGPATILGDDEMDCTFPPPSYACPAAELPVGTYDLFIISYTPTECASTATAGYTLRGVGGFSAELVMDNYGVVAAE